MSRPPSTTPQGILNPGHFRSYSSLRSSGNNSDEEGYNLPELSRHDSRTRLDPAHDTYSHDDHHQQLPMAYPPAPVGGPQQYQAYPLNDTPEGRSTPIGFRPRPTLITNASNSTVNTISHSADGHHFDEKRGLPYHGGNNSSNNNNNHNSSSNKNNRRLPHSRAHSFDAFAAVDDFDPSTSKDQNLRFAHGDAGTNTFSKVYLWLINRGIVVRWFIFIVPVVGLLWIPGILDYCMADREYAIWSVQLRWWSIWLTVVWLTLWGSKAFFMIFPTIFRNTLAAVVPNMKKYVPIVANLGKYAKYLLWSICINVSFTPLIYNHATAPNDSKSYGALQFILKFLIATIICMAVLMAEKAIIQLIAVAFHRDAYADRLADQKLSFNILTAMYIKSKHVPGTDIDGDTDTASVRTKGSQIPKVAVRKALRGLKSVAQSTTTALGNVASEMAGSSVLQTNSPANKVRMAITSANKSKALARRLFYSYKAPGADHLTVEDILPCFGFDMEKAATAFAILDRDGNGDATRDEMDAALLEIHRERLALEASIRDLDGAVKRLDEILIMVVCVIDILVLISFTGAADSKFNTWITSASTFVLSLSWMIGTTTQEILACCIFVFVKHPYDVGDRVDIDGNSYTVAKVELMSTSFKRIDGKFVWIAHNILTTKVIENVRRSGATSETYTFDVAFDTSFEQLQALREKMLRFCKDNNRDFLPAFDVSVSDMPDQAKMVLKADIKYKSNWQLGALKVQRRNKWVCQLKVVLMELEIWGPDGTGNPNPPPADPTRYTLVPWDEVLDAERAKNSAPPPSFHDATSFDILHSRHDSSTDLFDTTTRGGKSAAPTPGATPGLEFAPLPPIQPHFAGGSYLGGSVSAPSGSHGYFPPTGPAGPAGPVGPAGPATPPPAAAATAAAATAAAPTGVTAGQTSSPETTPTSSSSRNLPSPSGPSRI